MNTDWFVAAFRERYLEVYPHRDLPSARDEVAGLVAMRGSALAFGRTLDLGCGFGRHSLALAERGVRVVGMDLSADLLANRGILQGVERIEGRLARADMRTLPITSGRLDTVLCLFSSFGYFDDRGNQAVLEELRRVLVPGGRVLLDIMNPRRIRSSLVPRSERPVGDGRLIEVRSLSEDRSRVRKHVTLVAPDGRREEWHEDVRMYEPDELDALALAAGFRHRARYGDFDSSSFDDAAPRQLVWYESTGANLR